jgi:hypothetical protein
MTMRVCATSATGRIEAKVTSAPYALSLIDDDDSLRLDVRIEAAQAAAPVSHRRAALVREP